ncbi:MAG: GNAT family N-acetyltransferase [Bdellovibrio sp.]|nr:GNAT family N-acetyltransferase [Bdellovibrio sp.]
MNLLKTRFFRHYKNKPYKFLGIVRHSETLEELALYETLYENDHGKLWVRPKGMFFEDVVIADIKQPRFRPIEFKYKIFDQTSNSLMQEIKMIYLACFEKAFDQKKFLAKIADKKNFMCLLAYEDEKSVAMKLGYAISDTKFYSWLGAVRPEYQDLGLASELMRQQHEWCKQQKFERIEARSRNQFTNMISLNLANGFKITGTIPDQGDLKIVFEKDLT